ncbi:type III pantothenate kinase [Bacteroidetes/Chlorobi group bacterium ChocPot_Mid]|nr:MAG: type III pantothenate kinase [Bacteroidetes/Chlorobi group bacterium ChocPot_Mid]
MKTESARKSLLIENKSKIQKNHDFKHLLSLDIGNSRIKCRYKGIIQAFIIDKKWEKGLTEFLEVNQGLIDCACICSVNEVTGKRVFGLLKSYGIAYLRCSDLLTKQKFVNFKKVKGMGEDRKVGLIGASYYMKPPIITIDMGTAITINALGREGVCLGGVILPGAYTQMESLAVKTWGLEEIELKVTKKVLGLNTEKAISNGIVYGLEGAVFNIVSRIRKEYKELAGAKVILTGGGTSLLMKKLRESGFEFIYKEDLVLIGIEKLFAERLRNRRKKLIINYD